MKYASSNRILSDNIIPAIFISMNVGHFDHIPHPTHVLNHTCVNIACVIDRLFDKFSAFQCIKFQPNMDDYVGSFAFIQYLLCYFADIGIDIYPCLTFLTPY